MFAEALLDQLTHAKKVVVLTGAGISAESGIPTFREAQTGLWSKYDPIELATPQAFEKNPQLVWDWYAWRRSLVEEAKPNPGHVALAEWEAFAPSLLIVTQNVDGFHIQAGSQNVIELHGNIQRVKCDRQGHVIPEWQTLHGTPPPCPHCDSLLRPDVVWFGESLSLSSLTRAVEASRTADVFFSIGTSAMVQPAASLAIEAVQSGATLVEINPQETPLTPLANFAFQAPSGKILPRLTNNLRLRFQQL